MNIVTFKGVSQRLGLASLLALPFLGAVRPRPISQPVPVTSARMNAFTLDLMRQAAKEGQTPENLVVSAQGIYHALATTYIGSGGRTREELARVIGFPDDDHSLVQDLGRLRGQLNEAQALDKVEVRMTNSFWFDDRFAEFQDDYLRDVTLLTGNEPHRISFRNPGRAVERINRWVDEQTGGKVKRIIQPGDLASRSGPSVVDEPAFVALNALVFKGDWQSRFTPDATRDRPFLVNATRRVEKKMMHQRSLLRASRNELFQFLELPFHGHHFSMYLLLPHDPTPVPEILAGLTPETLEGLAAVAFPMNMDVLLPRFEIRNQVDAKNLLFQMGVEDAFEPRAADFGRMIVPHPRAFRVYLREVRQEAWIQVHEEGSEAVAVSSVVGGSFGCSATVAPQLGRFHAQHPFLYFIVHNESQSILLAGWVGDPNP